jgi:hypothetical protein
MKTQISLLLCLLILTGCSNVTPTPETVLEEPPEATGVTIVEAPAQTDVVAEAPDPTEVVVVAALDLTQLWSYGLTSIRTGDPLIAEDGQHRLDEGVISHGYNLVVDKNGNLLTPSAAPLHGGEQLILTEEYQEDHNLREYAHIYTLMAPIRDTILYHFEETSRDEWLAVTRVLTTNNIKTEDAPEANGRSVLSTEQVYDYIASGEAEGSPVMRYLEEAGLELKCLAFIDFNFINPEGGNHCEEHNLAVGSGIK